MSKIGIIYWTGTGNTESMAEAVAEGVKAAGADFELVNVSSGTLDVDDFDAMAFGSPATGDEEIEADEFEPYFSSVEDKLKDKPFILFGSYAWNEGDFMKNWVERCDAKGLSPKTTVIAYDAPDDEAIEACKAAGASLV